MQEVVKRDAHTVTLEKVRALETVMRQMDTVELPVNHHFCRGLYARELFVPKGCTLVGKKHAQQNFFLLLSGEMSVSMADGSIARIRAPFLCVTQPGDKRVGYAHEDSVCINFHPNPDDEQDLNVLEARYITPEALPAPDAKELLE